MNLSQSNNLTMKEILLSSPKKTNVQRAKSILWTSWYVGKEIGSKSLDIADKSLNTLSQWIANVHEQANTPNPINPDVPQAILDMVEKINKLSPEGQKLVDDVMQDMQERISQIMENDARERTNDKSDSV